MKTLSSSISKLKEAAAKTVATSKGKSETAAQKPASMQQQQVQKQPTTDDLKAKADALRKQVLSTCVCYSYPPSSDVYSWVQASAMSRTLNFLIIAVVVGAHAKIKVAGKQKALCVQMAQ